MRNVKPKHSAGGSTPVRKSTVKKRELRRVPSKTYENFYGLGKLDVMILTCRYTMAFYESFHSVFFILFVH